jgi:hypothetical protein
MTVPPAPWALPCHAPIDDDAGPTPVLSDHDQIVNILPKPKMALAKRGQPGVIPNVDGQAEPLGEQRRQRHVGPVQVRREMNDPHLGIDNARCTDRNAEQRACGLFHQPCDKAVHGVKRFLRIPESTPC